MVTSARKGAAGVLAVPVGVGFAAVGASAAVVVGGVGVGVPAAGVGAAAGAALVAQPASIRISTAAPRLSQFSTPRHSKCTPPPAPRAPGLWYPPGRMRVGALEFWPAVLL